MRIEQLTRANIWSRNARQLNEAFEIFRSVQETEFEKAPSVGIGDKII